MWLHQGHLHLSKEEKILLRKYPARPDVKLKALRSVSVKDFLCACSQSRPRGTASHDRLQAVELISGCVAYQSAILQHPRAFQWKGFKTTRCQVEDTVQGNQFSIAGLFLGSLDLSRILACWHDNISIMIFSFLHYTGPKHYLDT